ncbi:hypothetical protein NXU84_19595 [Parabacteroides distasonis]|nr:hypothetical protein [Parabacteroides distasonis]
MKELLKLGVYTLLGTLLLSAPFAGLGMLSTHLVTEKTFWIQLITLFLSAVSLQGLWLNPSKELCPWTYVDILPPFPLGAYPPLLSLLHTPGAGKAPVYRTNGCLVVSASAGTP